VYLFRLLGSLSGDEREAAYASPEAPERRSQPHPRRELSRVMRGVLAILAVAAPIFAWFSAGASLPHWLGGGGHAGPFPWGHAAPAMIVSALLSAATFAVYSRPRRRKGWEEKLAGFRMTAGPLARKFYFDDLYTALLVLPVKGFAWLLRLVVENFFIGILTLAGYAAEGLSLLLRQLQTGRTQQYAAGILLGAALGAYFLLRG
jgi:NADH:ubiquinone oxidoreductase subunit 5 (subunit L)/multisubunit Na+/H+ antiporter MnhA subunit